MDGVNRLAPDVGVARACRVMNIDRSLMYRQRAAARHLVARPVPPRDRPRPPQALSDIERGCVLDALNSERFANCSPRQTYATLLDEGVYLASVRTMYRLLAGADQVRERRRQLTHPSYTRPELLAVQPNEVWSWDITKLRGPGKWTYFHLYVILDIFSRYVVGWMIAPRETAELAEMLIADTVTGQNIEPGCLTLHADRGTSMRSKTVAALLVDLEVVKTHSRPYVSNDNPFSESHFKTLKYRPDFPDRFGCIEDARAHCQTFFAWYNTEHRHSGIALMTPQTVHYGGASELTRARSATLDAAFLAHPERFGRVAPRPPELPVAAWINPPKRKEPPTRINLDACSLNVNTQVSQTH